MELSPESVSSTTFKIVKKGCDPDEVKSYLAQLASSFEAMQKHAAAMEARARAATARLQEIAAQPPAAGSGAAQDEAAESISRALLLAQRTADATIRDATLEATQITMKAKVEAQVLVDGAQGMLNRLLDDAKADARRSAESERVQVQNEVESLLARRDFLLGDIESLEQHIVTQRERLRDVASALSDIVSKVPGGLADLRRPVMSASGDDHLEHEELPEQDRLDEHLSDDLHDDSGDLVRTASELAPPVVDDSVDIDTTPPWGATPPDPAALGQGDDTPVPMVLQQHSDALVAVPQSEPVIEGYYDVTKPMPRVRFAPGADLASGRDQPG